MKPLHLLILLFLSALSHAAITLPDSILSNITYSDTVVISKIFRIAGGAKVTFAPGTVVLVENGGLFAVDRGSFSTQGTAKMPVYFKPKDQNGKWGGIMIVDSSATSSMTYTSIEGGSQSNILLATKGHLNMKNCVLYDSHDGIYVQKAMLELDSCDIKNNSGYGILSGNTKLSITNSTISGNGEGGLFISDGTLQLDTSIIYDHKVNSDGGAINSRNSAITINKCEITSNSSFVNGGGIYSIGGSLLCNNVLFSDNSAVIGGAISASGTKVSISNALFYHSSATQGGAIKLYQSPLTVNRSYFVGNQVAGTNVFGADMCIIESKPCKITNSLFS